MNISLPGLDVSSQYSRSQQYVARTLGPVSYGSINGSFNSYSPRDLDAEGGYAGWKAVFSSAASLFTKVLAYRGGVSLQFLKESKEVESPEGKLLAGTRKKALSVLFQDPGREWLVFFWWGSSAGSWVPS